MTNPHPVTPTDIDIRAAADRVIAQLQQGRHAEALRLLERERAEERPVVQEALDRYVWRLGHRPNSTNFVAPARCRPHRNWHPHSNACSKPRNRPGCRTTTAEMPTRPTNWSI